MHVKVRITEQGKGNRIPNPDYAINRIYRHKVQMPGGFWFRLGMLNHLDYPERGHGCLKSRDNFTLEFTIPIGYVTNDPWSNNGSTPSFKEQDTSFVTQVDKYTLHIETRHEVQTHLIPSLR